MKLLNLVNYSLINSLQEGGGGDGVLASCDSRLLWSVGNPSAVKGL